MRTKTENEDMDNAKIAPLLRHFIGLDIAVEMKNGRSFVGTLHDADDYMNMVLCNNNALSGNRHAQNNNATSLNNFKATSSAATLYAQKNDSNPDIQSTTNILSLKENLNQVEYQLVHIRGPLIRYVHFPDRADLPALIKLGWDRARGAKDRYNRGKRSKRS